jgi:carbon-monoxide dehydrogenase medium subunit
VIPAAFAYRRASSVDEALALLPDGGDDAKLLAGGHSLLPLMKLRLAAPEVLVDIGRLDELRYVRTDGDAVAIGALTPHASLAGSPLLGREVPLLAHVASLVGDPQVRHRGTLGGSLAHADPAADLPAAVLALGGTLVARGPDGERAIAAEDFWTGFLETVLEPEELLIEVRVPRAPEAGWGYEKFTRRGNDWAIVAVAAASGKVALANMGPTPLRARATEDALAGGATIADAAALAHAHTSPSADLHAGPDFREHLARLLTRRALRACAAGRSARE